MNTGSQLSSTWHKVFLALIVGGLVLTIFTFGFRLHLYLTNQNNSEWLFLLDGLLMLYSVVGSVSSFVAYFFGIRSLVDSDRTGEVIEGIAKSKEKTDEVLKNLDEASAKRGQMLKQMQRVTDVLAEYLQKLPVGQQEIIEQIQTFLNHSEKADRLYVLLDSIAIGKIHLYNEQLIEKVGRETLNHQIIKINELLLDRAHDVKELYVATLYADHLEEKFIRPALHAFHYSGEITPDIVQGIVLPHVSSLHAIQSSFRDFNIHRKTLINPVLYVSDIPIQMIISEKDDDLKALIIYTGTYNMDKINQAVAFQTSLDELCKALISMFESLTQIERNLDYCKLREEQS